MPLPVSLEQVADELDCLMEGMTAYIHRETGEVLSLSKAELAIAEGEEDDDLGLDEEERAKLQEVVDSDKWVALPDQFEIHEWEIMRSFADTIEDERLQREILRALAGRGAFRRFKDTVADHGIRDRWFEFKKKALMEIARETLDRARIPYK
jgi:hypothetical protein